MGRIHQWSTTMTKLEKSFGVDVNKLHLLGIVDQLANMGQAIKVTELINKYTGASRATTHKAIKELVDVGLLRMVDSEEDGRVRYLYPGKKLPNLEKML